jgi:hypothetical protein
MFESNACASDGDGLHRKSLGLRIKFARNMHEHKKGGNFLTMVTNIVQSPVNGIVSQNFIGLTVSLHPRE